MSRKEHDERFRKLTKDFLKPIKPGFDDKLLPGFTFDIDDNDNQAEDCILIMGLNPAGDELDAEREKKGEPFFYYVGRNSIGYKIDKAELKSKFGIVSSKDRVWRWSYSLYYKPLFELFEKRVYKLITTTIYSVKWGWCNREWEGDLKEIIEKNDKMKKHERIIKGFYDDHHNNETTIYIGDMFYYHETDSKGIIKCINKKESKENVKTYLTDMLKAHIEVLKEHNKRVKYIYINNADVSKLLVGEDYNSNKEIRTYMLPYGSKNYKVFCGRILSNGASNDLKNKLAEKIIKYLGHES